MSDDVTACCKALWTALLAWIVLHKWKFSFSFFISFFLWWRGCVVCLCDKEEVGKRSDHPAVINHQSSGTRNIPHHLCNTSCSTHDADEPVSWKPCIKALGQLNASSPGTWRLPDTPLFPNKGAKALTPGYRWRTTPLMSVSGVSRLLDDRSSPFLDIPLTLSCLPLLLDHTLPCDLSVWPAVCVYVCVLFFCLLRLSDYLQFPKQRLDMSGHVRTHSPMRAHANTDTQTLYHESAVSCVLLF